MRDGSVRLADATRPPRWRARTRTTPPSPRPTTPRPSCSGPISANAAARSVPAADIWAFGVLSHVVLTGSRPLQGSTPSARRDTAVRYALGHDELRLSSELPFPWWQIIADCLARTHRERAVYDAASLLRRVESAAGTARSSRSHPLPRRWRWAATAAAGLRRSASG